VGDVETLRGDAMPARKTVTNEHVPHYAAEGTPWPRISLVTPVFNSAKYIEQTFQSVFAQKYPNLEYFVVDGGSTDGTVDIIRKYESQISGWISEPDNGMYEALNKGFARTTGEIMGWISATDVLHAGALAVVGSIFRDMPPEVEWITGRPTYLSEDGMTARIKDLPRWSRYRFLVGANRHIQQESTYWCRSLWEKVGSRMDSSSRMGADFELWVRFFRHAKLYPVDSLIGAFRDHGDSLGLAKMEEINGIHDAYIEAELKSIPWGRSIHWFRFVSKLAQSVPKVRWFWKRLVMNPLYRLRGPDFPPPIRYQTDRWKFWLGPLDSDS